MELRQQGMTIDEISWRAGYPATEVFRVLWRYEIEPPRTGVRGAPGTPEARRYREERRQRLVDEMREATKTRVLRDLRADKLVSQEEAEQIHEMWAQGLNMMQIAALTGRGQTTIHRVLSHPPRPPKHRSPEELRQLMEQIIDLRLQRRPIVYYRGGRVRRDYSYRAIAEALGISTTQVIQLLRRAGLAGPMEDPETTHRHLAGRMYSIYHRIERRPTEETMENAIVDLEDIASLALMRVETMPEEWKDAEPDLWWKLGWLRHCAVTSISALETAISAMQALRGTGPLRRVYGADLRLPRVRERLYRSIRAVMRVLRSLLVHLEEEYQDQETSESVLWAQTALILAGSE